MSIIENKRDIVMSYCYKIRNCETCILNDASKNWKNPITNKEGTCLSITRSDEEDLDEAIDLILNNTHDIEIIKRISNLISESKELDKAHDTDKLKEALSYSVNDPSGPNMIREKLGFPPYKVNDSVNSPSHYTDGKIEVIDYIEDKKLGFCLGNAIKYISRAGKKDKDKEAEDISKAIWYLKRYLKQLEEA